MEKYEKQLTDKELEAAILLLYKQLAELKGKKPNQPDTWWWKDLKKDISA